MSIGVHGVGLESVVAAAGAGPLSLSLCVSVPGGVWEESLAFWLL